MPSLTKVQTGFLAPQGAFELDPGTASAPGLKFSTSAATGMFSPSTGALAFSTGSFQNALNILSGGNVGIGVVNPLVKLHVDGSIHQTWSDTRIGIFYDNSYRQGLAYSPPDRTLKIFSTTNDSGGNIAFYTRIGLGASDTDYGIERLRITATGNVGIGTTNPTSKLQVEGELNTKGGAIHEVFDVLNINPAGTGFDSIGNNSDGGATSWQVVGSRVVDLFNTSGSHGGTWGFPVRINTAGWYKLRVACRLSSTNGDIHGSTLSSNYKFNIGFSFGCGTVGIDSDQWDVDTLGNGARVAKIGSTGYLNVGTYQMTYSTSGYSGIKQIYIYSLELIRVG